MYDELALDTLGDKKTALFLIMSDTEDVYKRQAENTAPVRNMKQYLLAMLYNAPTTMNLYYQNKTNHDFARGSPGR